jgi:hypothetical protein
MLDMFLARDDEFRKVRFKFIPRVVESSWLVKKGVGQQPAILGNKLTQLYFYDYKHNICEVAIDVGSSKVGAGLFKLVRGYATSIQIDMHFLFEGTYSLPYKPENAQKPAHFVELLENLLLFVDIEQVNQQKSYQRR